MSVRQPVRLLDIANLVEAYPLELLADFSTGNFTLVKQDGSTVEHKKPGTLTVKYGDTTLLNNGNLYDALSITIPAVTTISGNAETATKLKTAVKIGITGGATGTAQSFDGSASINIPVTSLDATKLSGVAPLASIPNIPWNNIDNKPTIYQPSTTDPLVAGTVAVGTATTFARADHVHPAQTSVSGNAGTATKFASTQTIELTGDATGSASSQAGWSIAVTLANSGVTLGSYGPSANVSPAHGGTFSVPYITVDAKGRVTAASTKTITLPTYSVMGAASASAAGTSGLVPAPAAGKNTAFLRGDGTWVVPTNTTYSAGTGLTLSGTTFNHSNSITAGTAQGDASKTLSFGGTFTIPTITYDAQGHITGKGTTTMTMPAAPTSVSGNAGSATKLATARSIGLSGVTATAQSFNGTADITIPITAVPASLLTGTIDIARIPKAALERLIPVADDDARLALTSDDAQNGDVIKVEATGLMYYIVDDTKLGGTNAASAFSAFTAGTAASVDWSGITNKPTFATVATSGSYNDLSNKPTIYQPATTTPLVAGTAAVGTATTFARADHVHPLQTTVSGNAGTATKFASAQSIELTGDVTGSASSQAGWSIAATLASSGVTAGSYGPSANASPAHSGTFSVPYITVDAKGRVTAAKTITITLPSDNNTHYTTHLYVGASGAASNAATSNGSTYLKLYDDSTSRASFKIVGSGATTVSSDASGNITITSSDTVYSHPTYTSYSSGLYKITVDGTGHVSAATAVAKSDITSLGIPAQDTVYTHPTYTSKTSGLYKITVDGTGHVSATAAVAKSDITTLGIPAQDTTYSVMTGATASAAGSSGLVPAPASGKNTAFLRGDGTWATPADTVYTHPTYTSRSSGLYKITVDGTGHVSAATTVAKSDITALGIPAQDTTYSVMGAASASAAGTSGLVPAPAAGKNTAFLRGDGTWATPYTHPTYTSYNSGLYKITVDGTGHVSAAIAVAKSDITALGIPAQDTVYTHPTYTSKTSGLYKITVDGTGHVSATAAVAKSDITALGIPAQDTTYSVMTGATASATGSSGLVPAPAAGKNTAFLRGDGTWVVPTNTTYSAGTGLTLSGTTFNHSNSITAGTAQGSATGALAFGGTFTIPTITYDAQGHITGKGTTTMTMPAAPTSVSGNAGTATSLATARTLTIGNTGKTFDGSADVSWALSEIGALPSAGGTLTGALTSRSITLQAGYTLTVSTAGNVSGIAVKYTATIGTAWTGSEAPYTQTISITGIKSTDVPIVDFVNSGTYATDQAREEAWGNIYRIVPAAGKIIVYSHAATTTECPIQLLVIR